MTVADSIAALAIAALALYGVGLPLAWLMPAPSSSSWITRIAVAPLPAILVATVAAWGLGAVGVRLHWYQLAVVAAVAWVAAWTRTRHQWRVRESLGSSGVPFALVSLSGATWVASLVGYGLYLPNRDFKNHAYLVAQVAYTGSSDMSLVLRPSPITPPVGGLYPAGLHTLLGWSLPSSDYNTLGVTAAAAVVVVTISLPLALVALARMVDPHDRVLALAVGSGALLLPGLTGTFTIGSVVLLVGTATYAAALVLLWQWVRAPRAASAVAVVVATLGLLVLHVAEAVGLVLVSAVAILLPGRYGPLALMGSRDRRILLAAAGVIAAAGLAMALELGLTGLFDRPLESWDVEPNTFNVVTAPLAGLLTLGGGSAAHFAVLAITLAGGGFLLVRERAFDRLLVAAITVPMGLALIAGVAIVPDLVRAATAPWYGSIGRVSLLLGPVLAVVAGVAVAAFLRETARLVRARRGGLAAWAAAGLFIAPAAVWTSMALVDARRGDLEATLAGAGDTPTTARELVGRLAGDETVLNFEADGTANLFAAARVPVVSGLSTPRPGQVGDTDVPWLMENLLRVSEPAVASHFKHLNVAFVALGTTSMYWGQDVGYTVESLVSLPEFSVALVGSDMVVLRYSGQ